MQNFNREQKRQKRISETVDYLFWNIQNAKANFKRKTNYVTDGKIVGLAFPEGYMIISCKLNKDESIEFNKRIATVEKCIKKSKVKKVN